KVRVVSPLTSVRRSRWVTTKTGTPKPGSSPQPSARSCMVRPTIHAPSAKSVSGPPDDPRAARREQLVKVRLVDLRRAAPALIPVRGRIAEHPVVQSLTAIAKPGPDAVVRAGDVAVDRHRDRCEHLRHLDTSMVLPSSAGVTGPGG